MSVFQKLRSKQLAVMTTFVVALGLLMSILVSSPNAFAADSFAQQPVTHQSMSDNMDMDTSSSHHHGMDCCVVACGCTQNQQDIVAVADTWVVMKWISVGIVPAHMSFSPQQRPPRA